VTKVVCLEGIDGVGKTSLGKKIEQKINAITLHEPFGETRDQIFYNNTLPEQKLALFLKNRSENVERIKQLKSTNTYEYIILDRFTLSTIAYQSYNLNLSIDYLISLENIFRKDFTPDYTYLFTINSKNIIQYRLQNKGENPDIKQLEKLKTIQSIYVKAFIKLGWNGKILDSSRIDWEEFINNGI